MALKTRYEFTLPRGYVDPRSGELHSTGTMRLATARDELEPLRDPTINGPDDPRLTVLILARVVETLGSLEMVTAHEIENLFAADLAFLQDFYGVINFGNQAEYEALLASQAQALPLAGTQAATPPPAPEPEPVVRQEDMVSAEVLSAFTSSAPDSDAPRARTRVEEMPRQSG